MHVASFTVITEFKNLSSVLRGCYERRFVVVSPHSGSLAFLYGCMHAPYRNRVMIRCMFWVLVGAAGKNPVVSEPVKSSKPSTPRKAYAAYDWGTSGGE